MNIEEFRSLDPEHYYEYSFVHHWLLSRGLRFTHLSDELLAPALKVLTAYDAAIGELHNDEGELFWRVWEPSLSGLLRAEAFLTYGISRPSAEQWREIFARVCGQDAPAYVEGPPLQVVTSELRQ